VKARHTLNNEPSRKRPIVIGTVNNSSPSNTAAKKMKIVCTAEEPTGNCYNLEHISDDVQKRIVKWQRKHNSPEIKILQEHTDYKLNSTGNLVIDIWCRFCTEKHVLSQKEVKSGKIVALLSGHVPKCVEKFSELQMLEKSKQPTITSKFQLKNKQQAPVTLSIKPDQDSGTVQDGKKHQILKKLNLILKESNNLRTLKVVMKF